jgi:hypothetical protein
MASFAIGIVTGLAIGIGMLILLDRLGLLVGPWRGEE